MSVSRYTEIQHKFSTYDQRLEITDHEVMTLSKTIEGHVNSRSLRLRQAENQIPRIMKPLLDALQYLGCPELQIRNLTVDTYLREVLARRQLYWGWTPKEYETWWSQLATRGIPQYKERVRFYLVGVAYLVGGYDRFWRVGYIRTQMLAKKVFGEDAFQVAYDTVSGCLFSMGYGGGKTSGSTRHTTLALLMLRHRSPDVTTFEAESIKTLQAENGLPSYMPAMLEQISRALFGLGVLEKPMLSEPAPPQIRSALIGVSSEWADWCERWRETSPGSMGTRYRRYYLLLQVGRWLSDVHPEITSPKQWTRQIAAEFIAAVDQMHCGQYAYQKRHFAPDKPLSANSKKNLIASISVFFQDCQEWEWIERRFDPRRSFHVSRHIIAAVKTPPRVVAEDVWAKLVWAGLNLTQSDLTPHGITRDNPANPRYFYPLEMLQALVAIWLFAGLRSDEIHRLRTHSVRWQPQETDDKTICLLEVPTNKTGPAFVKPVDGLVGEAIEKWEQMRPELPAMLDRKTGEYVNYLFVYRATRLGKNYINQYLIPLLCEKAGIPIEQARGKITSHRARSTIATQLFNAREPMTLFELQAWLGHRTPQATQRYVQLTPTRLTQAYADADYFKRNLRRIEVLVDQDAVLSGAAADGEPWKFYDLGHGYCTYDFFDQCLHRMACAKCDFYKAKGTSSSQLLEAKSNLQRMLQEIPLTDEECAAVEDGVEAVSRLMEKLADIPTPAGPTPRQLQSDGVFIPLAQIPSAATSATPYNGMSNKQQKVKNTNGKKEVRKKQEIRVQPPGKPHTGADDA